MRFYLSHTFSTKHFAKKISAELVELGHVCAYDNFDNDDIRIAGESVMTEASFNTVQAIRDAELFILLCPPNRSNYIELGIALSSRYGKRIVIWSPTGREFTPGVETTVYYFHPSVIRFSCSNDEFVEYLKSI